MHRLLRRFRTRLLRVFATTFGWRMRNFYPVRLAQQNLDQNHFIRHSCPLHQSLYSRLLLRQLINLNRFSKRSNPFPITLAARHFPELSELNIHFQHSGVSHGTKNTKSWNDPDDCLRRHFLCPYRTSHRLRIVT